MLDMETRIIIMHRAVALGAVAEAAREYHVPRQDLYNWARTLWPGGPRAFSRAVKAGKRQLIQNIHQQAEA